MKLFVKLKNERDCAGEILLNFFSDKYLSDKKRMQIIDDCICLEFDVTPGQRPLTLITAIATGEIVEALYGEPFVKK